MEVKEMKKITYLTSVLSFIIILVVHSVDAQTIKIGFIGPFSGEAAYQGTMNLVGGKVAAKMINDSGGVLGRKIEIIEADSRGIPAEAVNAFKKLVLEDKVVAAVGAYYSSSTMAVAPAADSMKVVLISGISFMPDLSKTPHRYLFKHAHTVDVERYSADYAVNVLGIRKFSFLARNDDWGRSTIIAFADRLVKIGGEALSKDFYNPGEKDFTSHFTKIKALNPEGIFMVDTAVPGATQQKAIRDLGINAYRFGSDGFCTPIFPKLCAGAEEGMYVITRYESYLDAPKGSYFVPAYKAMHGEWPGLDGQAGFDSINILAQAIERAKRADPEILRDALMKTDYISVNGSKIVFDKTQQAIPAIYQAKYHNGVRVIIRQLYPYVPYK
jgi:branched-chain amino acid transport system substrate-binding protein